jgi:hypothetical protein
MLFVIEFVKSFRGGYHSHQQARPSKQPDRRIAENIGIFLQPNNTEIYYAVSIFAPGGRICWAPPF